jgi:hypothetical protein
MEILLIEVLVNLLLLIMGNFPFLRTFEILSKLLLVQLQCLLPRWFIASLPSTAAEQSSDRNCIQTKDDDYFYLQGNFAIKLGNHLSI